MWFYHNLYIAYRIDNVDNILASLKNEISVLSIFGVLVTIRGNYNEHLSITTHNSVGPTRTTL